MNHRRPIPYGFEADAMKPHEVLKPKYHCNGKQIRRWRIELGLPTEKEHRKPIEQYSVDGAYITTYPSMRDAARAIGARKSENISHCASGQNKSAYGYVWRFANAD